LLKDLGIKIIILSRGRSQSITTTKVLPEFIEVLVPESQKSLYEAVVRNPIITTPDDVLGLGKLRNWCIDNFKEETVIMMDDDISRCYSLTGLKSKRLDKEQTLEVLVNTAIMAKDAGCKCFGFTQTDIRKYNATNPFSLCTWVGGVIGVIGKGRKFRNDKFKVDIDFCLENLLTNRILWCDNRFLFSQKRDSNVGGNSEFRTKDSYKDSTNSLKEKWGKYVIISEHNSQLRIKLNVQRKQQIQL